MFHRLVLVCSDRLAAWSCRPKREAVSLVRTIEKTAVQEQHYEEGKVTELRDRDIYKENWVGLKGLDDKGALRFETTEGGHMQLSSKVLKKTFKENFGRLGRKFDDGEAEVIESEEEAEWQLEL